MFCTSELGASRKIIESISQDLYSKRKKCAHNSKKDSFTSISRRI